jgi:hypothetical protein
MSDRQKLCLNIAACMLLVFLLLLWWTQSSKAQTSMGPIKTPQVNQQLYVGQSGYSTIQSAITYACKTGNYSFSVIILPGVATTDTPTSVTGGCSGTHIQDQRVVPFTYYEWNGTHYSAVVSGGSFPSGAVVYGVNNSTSRPATSADVAALWGCSGTLNSDGTCSTPGSGGGAGGTGPQYKAAVYNGTGSGTSYAQGHANWGQGATPNDLTVPGAIWNQQFGLNEYSATGSSTVPPGPGNNNSNGIANAQTAIGPNGPGAIRIEPNYSTWEQAIIDTATNDRILWEDNRQGRFHLKSQNPGFSANGIANYQFDCLASKNLPGSDNPGTTPPTVQTCMGINLNFDVPGFYYGAISPAQPSGWFGETLFNIIATFASASINKSLISAQIFDLGRGDAQTIDLQIDNEYGGQDSSADEGIHNVRWINTIGGSEFHATLWQNGEHHATLGYSKLYLYNQAGGIGVMRQLLNTTTGVIADTAIGQALTGDGSSTLTMTLTNYPVSRMVTTTAAIQPPTTTEQTKTSMAFTVNTTVDLKTAGAGGTSLVGTAAEFAGNVSVECGTIQALGTFSGGTQQVTMLLSEHHDAGAKLYIGGMACHFLVTDASVQSVTWNAHATYYVLGSTANNTLIVARQAQIGMDAAIGGVGAVHIYQGARVLDVRCSSTCNYGAVPGIDGQELKVEDTGATWNNGDNVLAGMIATSANDTFYYNLTDNHPMSAGSTLLYVLNGAQMGGYSPRDFIFGKNTTTDATYTWGGGQYTMGAVLHWTGPVKNVVVVDNLIHGSFFTDFQCGFLFAQSYASSIQQMCPGTFLGGPDAGTLSSGWQIQGDVQISPSGIPSSMAAQFSYAKGNRLAPTIIASPSVNNTPNGALVVNNPPDDSTAFTYITMYMNGLEAINGTQIFHSVAINQRPVSGRYLYQSFLDASNAQLAYIENQYQTFHIAASTQIVLESTANALVMLGANGVAIGGQYIYTAAPLNSGATAPANGSACTQAGWGFYNDGNEVWCDGTTNHVEAPPGAGTTRPAAPTSLTASVMTARRNCKGHGAGEIWADDRYIYHCKANGSGYNEAILGRTTP